ncbi:MAG: GreA/GreB family elongation factor [Pseudomonas sp.]|uniref:GreA/GreB family elongation factor n=1 Tax=Pseudomonas sp. TaxID=306 RepID=UPI00339553B7
MTFPDKNQLRQAILAQLDADLQLLQRAAQTAYEAATHEENIAENKYDTLGLEASYLATGQARRVEELRQAHRAFQQLVLRPFEAKRGIQLGALVSLSDTQGIRQWLFLGPDGAGVRVGQPPQQVTVITPRSPLGQRLLGKQLGDELELTINRLQQRFEIVQVC